MQSVRKLVACSALAVMPLLAPLPAGAVTEANFAVETTGDLVALCSADPKAPLGTAALNFCHGFVAGAVRVQQANDAARRPTPLFCLPSPPPSRDAAINEFVEWAKAEPARLEQRPFESMFRFLAQKHPCPAAKGRGR
ncbi:MAG: Rap1a/Tai family immunity protein [Acetobacteraceae bacterium]